MVTKALRISWWEAVMSDPIAVLIRFSGDPDDLVARFERAIKSWMADHRRIAGLGLPLAN